MLKVYNGCTECGRDVKSWKELDIIKQIEILSGA